MGQMDACLCRCTARASLRGVPTTGVWGIPATGIRGVPSSASGRGSTPYDRWICKISPAFCREQKVTLTAGT